MKEVRNAKLRHILNKDGIKDVVIWFVDGVGKAVSDDDFTDEILNYAYDKNAAYVPSFNQMSIQEWVDFVREAFDEGLERYNNRMESAKSVNRDEEGRVVIKMR